MIPTEVLPDRPCFDMVSTGSTCQLSTSLSSVIAVLDASGNLLSEQRYPSTVLRASLPFGQVRDDVGTIDETDFGYTSQRAFDAQNTAYSLGLMDYRARFYSPLLGRFLQPDTLVPGAGNPQAFNRYSYASNNPLNYNDPSGHLASEICMDDGECKWDGSKPPRPSKPNIFKPSGNQIQINIAVGWTITPPKYVNPVAIALFYSLNIVTDNKGGIQLFYTKRDQELADNFSGEQGAYNLGPAEEEYPSSVFSFSVTASYGWIYGSEFEKKGTDAFAGRAVDVNVSVGLSGDYYEGFYETTGDTDPSKLMGFDIGYGLGIPIGFAKVSTETIPISERYQMSSFWTNICKNLGMCGELLPLAGLKNNPENPYLK